MANEHANNMSYIFIISITTYTIMWTLYTFLS